MSMSIIPHLKTLSEMANKKDVPVFGTLLYRTINIDHKLDNRGIILLGNESRGISDELVPFITHRIMIPGAAGQCLESIL